MLTEPLEVTLLVVAALNTTEIPYFVGGSMATAFHGIARSTMDVDIVADMREDQTEPFVEALGTAFYADAAMMQDAIRRQSSFNVIHLKTMFKVDIFVRKRRAFDQAQFARRVLRPFSESPLQSAYVASPEDNILAKLEWYRLGGEVSDRQWQDIVNVVDIQGDRLDRGYLRRWAGELGVSDLLERALQSE